MVCRQSREDHGIRVTSSASAVAFLHAGALGGGSQCPGFYTYKLDEYFTRAAMWDNKLAMAYGMDRLAIRVMVPAQDNTKDSLTGLLDHRSFRDLVDTLLESAEMRSHVALVYFNVENFKHYNQRYGFTAGDTLLKHLATSISEALPHAVAARFAADQFVVYAEANNVSQNVKKVRAAFRAEHKDASIWLRVGYYVLTPYDNDAGVACDRAKLACDELRGRRDAYICEYDDVLQHEIKWRRYVLEHFDEALENGWIRAWCQPIVRVATGETCDVEVLARWIDPTEGIMPPYEFIPVLEEARIVHRLDLAVLRDVCRSCRALEDAGKPYLSPSVNLSRLDFELCDIVSEVENVLEEYGIPRSRVAIEVTESALVGNHEFLGDEIERFRSEGFEVWMDDFGSGYSSLNVLKDYTFDLVKIDMAFLQGLEESEQARVMLAKVIDMAKELGLKTLVEGVETRAQYDFLRSLGCGRVQGYLFGRPSPLPDSIDGAQSVCHPQAELLEKREFYERIGRVNLMRPDPHPSVDGHYLPSDVAASIIRRRNGRYEYLNTNLLFEKFLHDSEGGTTRDSEYALNDMGNPRRIRFVSAVEETTRMEDWAHYTVTVNDHPIAVRVRLISQEDRFDAVAVLVIVDESYVTVTRNR